MSAAKISKKAVNLSISASLLLAARDNDINLSATLESALADQLRQLGRRQWLKENGDAIDSYNRDVEEHGTFSDGLRTF
jgi:antitoxin CcdA